MAMQVKSARQADRPRDSGSTLINWSFPIYLGAILLGLVSLRGLGMTGSHNGIRALFIAVNAATLTGFRQNPGITDLNPIGLEIVLMLIAVGSLFSMIVGALAVRRIARLEVNDRQIIMAALVAESLALLVGTACLWQGGRSSFNAMFLAASAFGNCGLTASNLPSSSDLTTHLAILPLTILGGLGLPVLMELYGATFGGKSLSIHSRTVISTSAWLYVIGFVLIFGLNLAHIGSVSPDAMQTAAPSSSVLAIESRTGGLDIAPLRTVGPGAQWILILLMAIGASPAGTGGGLKTTTLAQLFEGGRRLLRGRPVGRPLGIALAWLGIYLGMIILGAALLAYLHDAPDGSGGVLFNAVSAFSNVGLSVSELPDTPGLLYAYSAIMLLGRLTPVLILWWMAETTTDAEMAIG